MMCELLTSIDVSQKTENWAEGKDPYIFFFFFKKTPIFIAVVMAEQKPSYKKALCRVC